MTITRIPSSAAGRSRGSTYGDLVFAVATAPGDTGSITEQTRETLAALDAALAEGGTDKRRILQATVYIADMDDKAAMDRVWGEWIGPDPAHWPQRACVGTALAGGTLVEIVLIAARGGA